MATRRCASRNSRASTAWLRRPNRFSGLRVLTTPHFDPQGGLDSWKFVTLALCMMAGTASLPHILMRYFTTPSVRAARKSVGWSLFFIFLLYFTAPALATLTKLQLLDPTLATAVVGKAVEDVTSLEWIRNWTAVGMLSVADQNGDGIVQLNEFFMRPDIVVLATPEIAGLPYVISGLVAAGGMAAAMSTADGLLLAIANALSHDLYYKIIDPQADTKRRLIVARMLLVGIGAAAAMIASLQLTGILGAVAWAFCFACSGLFFPPCARNLVEARQPARGGRGHDRRIPGGNGPYLVHVYNGGEQLWSIDHLRFGIIGMPVSLVAMVVVSLMTRAPDAEMQAMVDETRVPTGKTILASTQ